MSGWGGVSPHNTHRRGDNIEIIHDMSQVCPADDVVVVVVVIPDGWSMSTYVQSHYSATQVLIRFK